MRAARAGDRDQTTEPAPIADRELQPDQRAVRAADERREPGDAEVVEHGDHRVGLVGRVERQVDRAVGADPVDRDDVVLGRVDRTAGADLGVPPAGFGELRARRDVAIGRDPAEHDDRRQRRVAERLPAQTYGWGPPWRSPSVRSSCPRRCERAAGRGAAAPPVEVRASTPPVEVRAKRASKPAARGGRGGRARADNVAGIMVSSGHGLPKERRGGGCRLARTSRPIFRWTRFRPRRTWHLATSYVSLVAPASTGLSLSRISMGFPDDRVDPRPAVSTRFPACLGCRATPTCVTSTWSSPADRLLTVR